VIGTALGRGIRKRCPHCGRGAIFSGWGEHNRSCAYCGLVFERNQGDTWLFTIIGDRIPIILLVAAIYFGIARSHPIIGGLVFAVAGVAIIWTAPNRWGIGIAIHYLSRVYYPDPDDPIPRSPGPA
jgi:uncharacterized protein (DUF983 family)